jgi:broad specificity phosphatase PhoE
MSAWLLLIRHSLPAINPQLPAEQWRLSAEGRARCAALADQASVFHPQQIISSVEPKAQETAELIAARLSLPWRSASGLHEHERRTAPFTSTEAFTAAVARLFARPDQCVFGEETADQAHTRLDRALTALLMEHPRHTLAVVSHGTVIALWLSRRLGILPFPLWQSLGLPALLALDLEKNNLIQLPPTYL